MKSTFTAALIISFLSLAQSVIGSSTSVPFQYGMFFSVIAIGFHLFATVVAARAGMICFRLSKSLDIHGSPLKPQTEELRDIADNRLPTVAPIVRSWHDPPLHISDFQRFLVLCEQLQLIGTTIYFPSALFTLFYMFDKIHFAIVIYAMTGVGGWAVYRLGFWKVSVLWHDLHHICSRFKELILKAGGRG